jgi:hypothetical protein
MKTKSQRAGFLLVAVGIVLAALVPSFAQTIESSPDEVETAAAAVFGLQMQVINATDAVLYLGLEKTKALVLLAHTFSYFEGT